MGLRAGDAIMWREELVPGQNGKKKKNLARSSFCVLEFSGKIKIKTKTKHNLSSSCGDSDLIGLG